MNKNSSEASRRVSFSVSVSLLTTLGYFGFGLLATAMIVWVGSENRLAGGGRLTVALFAGIAAGICLGLKINAPE